MHTPRPHILLLSDYQILLTSHSGELEGPSNSIGLRLSSGSCFPNWSPWSVLHPNEWWRTLLSSSHPLFKPLYSACFTHYISLEFILIAVFMAMTLVQTPSFPLPACYTHRKVCLLPISSTYQPNTTLTMSPAHSFPHSEDKGLIFNLHGRVPPAFHSHPLPLHSFSSSTWTFLQALSPAPPCVVPPERKAIPLSSSSSFSTHTSTQASLPGNLSLIFMTSLIAFYTVRILCLLLNTYYSCNFTFLFNYWLIFILSTRL